MTLSCREDCDAAAEPLAGSAGQAFAFVAIAWPKPLWHVSDVEHSSGLPTELAELKAEFASAGRKLSIRLFQREQQPPTECVELIAYRDPAHHLQARELPLGDLVPRLRRFLAGDDATAEPLAPTLFVCTDGKHDRCCALRGRPLLLALRAEIARRGDSTCVVESSHLGGHRFAANCLALPAGELYGRLDPEDAPALLEQLSGGRVYARRYRGRLGLGERLQTAEALLHAQHPDAIDVELLEQDDERAAVRARLRTDDGERMVDISLAPESFSSLAACDDPAPKLQARWVASRPAAS